ncbi:uncharacterized protein [Miscanthus floridulus]|uniref:uncharacterized protein isoform X8 n=1 Tax=Miscanthus floridulus TaxID=154761 RepID=UPI0034577EC7
MAAQQTLEAPVHAESSGIPTSAGRRARPRNNTSCPLETSNPAACRSKRRKLLNQHRLVWRGAASRHSADLDCGQFDEAFVEALKGAPCSSQGFSAICRKVATHKA